MRSVLALAAAAAAALAAIPGGSAATHECDGLDVCISARGPWVAVPAARRGRQVTVYYRMVCPRRAVVGGVDAVLGSRALDVGFVGRLGSPVSPGITTGRNALFVATYAGRRPTAFRPLIGCIPTGGGGGSGTRMLSAALRRARPPVRRVRTLKVPAGRARRVVVRCRGAERLVASSHAIGFRTRRLPTASILEGARVARRERARSVAARVRRTGAVPRSTRVEAQVHAVCAGSP